MNNFLSSLTLDFKFRTVASALNSLAAVTMQDFLGTAFGVHLPDRKGALVAKALSIAYGAVSFGLVNIYNELFCNSASNWICLGVHRRSIRQRYASGHQLQRNSWRCNLGFVLFGNVLPLGQLKGQFFREESNTFISDCTYHFRVPSLEASWPWLW